MLTPRRVFFLSLPFGLLFVLWALLPISSVSATGPIYRTMAGAAADLSAVTDPADLQLTKSATVNGSLVLYTIQVTNLGVATAHNLVVTDPIPTGVKYLSTIVPSGAPWTCSYTLSSNTVTCALGVLAAGSVTQFAIQVSVSNPPALFTNCATVSSTLDPNPANNTGCVTLNGHLKLVTAT
ncbi:MAG: DUF11 domain-containing protein, partial [Anaerolineae bacterium]